MLTLAKEFLDKNRTHVVYVLIILVSGLLTNYAFSRYKEEHTLLLAAKKELTTRKNDVRVVTKQVVVKEPVYIPGEKEYVYKIVESLETVSEDKTSTVTDTSSKTSQENNVKEGRTPLLTAGVGVKLATEMDLHGFVSARLYGPFGAFVAANTQEHLKSWSSYAGVAFSY